jgi:hypothetical protein
VLIKPPYLGIFPGEVTKNVFEPGHTHKGTGSVLAICPSISGDREIGPCLPLGTVGGGAPGRGIFAVPDVGAAVGLLFFGGDPSAAYYIAGWYGCPGGTLETPSPGPSFAPGDQGDPDIVVWETSKWRVILANDTFDRLRIESKTTPGSFIEIDGGTGKMTLETSDLQLGGMATEAAVLGTAFLALYNGHTHTETGTVTSTPIVPMVAGTHTSAIVKVL